MPYRSLLGSRRSELSRNVGLEPTAQTTINDALPVAKTLFRCCDYAAEVHIWQDGKLATATKTNSIFPMSLIHAFGSKQVHDHQDDNHHVRGGAVLHGV